MRFCITIRGRVQGVFFRKFTAEMARELGILGFVMNQEDGSVYCEAEGRPEQLQLFLDCCGEGSMQSKVTSVEVEMKDPLYFKDFEILK